MIIVVLGFIETKNDTNYIHSQYALNTARFRIIIDCLSHANNKRLKTSVR